MQKLREAEAINRKKEENGYGRNFKGNTGVSASDIRGI